MPYDDDNDILGTFRMAGNVPTPPSQDFELHRVECVRLSVQNNSSTPQTETIIYFLTR